MAFKRVFLFLVAIIASTATATRDMVHIKPGDVQNLAAMFEASGGLVECWNALLDLKSCSNDIILFFLDGQSSIGPNCCSAIETITRNCWPSMLSSLGFTAQEGSILRGYCDAESSATPPPLLPPTASPIKLTRTDFELNQ
ncbi:hypothetical protein K2173_014855 [Erythroxylum novogranatense]|uniref:Prolamin-like domain-containing protein n=1 Tax=Erythroxylum novogranatense TaxID=1862640 RepID=A0AAV8TG83_9ROSI|nr:hypothetical protein K2173_014855 [Erythroxylum novogranatense]